MASRFIPPPNRLNQISNKKSKRSFSDDSGQSIFHELKKNVRDKHTADAFEQVGSMNAIVLEVIDTPVDNILWKNPMMSYLKEEKGVLPDYIEIRFRIPELHAHLPEPENASDWAAINRHPKALMTKDKAIPEVGDIVVIDFQDKNNFSGASVSATVNSSNPPAGGGVCKASEAFGSGEPTLNLNQPQGDAQEPSGGSEKQEFTNDPSTESYSEGIDYDSNKNTQITQYVHKLYYLVSLSEFDTMPEFSDVSLTFDSLLRKDVYNVCFTLAHGDKRIRDVQRLKKIMIDLKSKGVRVGLMIRQDYEHFMDNFKFLSSIIKETFPDYFINHYTTESSSEAIKVDKICSNLTMQGRIRQFAYFSHETDNSLFSVKLEHCFKIFASKNHYDFNLQKDNSPKPYSKFSISATPLLKRRDAFRLGGINFLKTPEPDGDPCLYGERTGKIFFEEFKYAGAQETLIDDYSRLEKDILSVVKGVTSISDTQKQNFLSSVVRNEKKQKAEVRNTTNQSFQDDPIGQPVDNTPTLGVENSSVPTQSAPIENNASPGLQCAPLPGLGGLPNPVGNGELVQPPTLRFSEVPNYQELGWTTDADKGVNNVILDFMNRFTSAYYRRIPMNDPINTGSAYKKIRVTSTLRTASKQVYLMWDKMDKGGENAVWSLYGSSAQWVKDVVAEWKRHKTGDAGANARAVASVQANIDRGKQSGKRGHNYGSGVDIHTWSHLKAEGQPYEGVSEAQMKNTRFIRAVVEAAKEAGGKPVVESYQQHVHITIL
jgi:hypothetical protein